jgi:multidrug resistance efflux pump
MTWQRVLIGVLVAAVLAASGVFIYRQFFAPEPAESSVEPEPTAAAVDRVNTIAVDTGVDTVSAEGQIVPLRSTLLAFTGTGILTEVLAQEGQNVTAGQPIVRLDSEDQQLALTQAESQLAQSQANLTAAQAALRAAEAGVQAADLGVQAAKIELALVSAEPTPEEIALRESNVALANARISQASAAQQLVLEGVADSQIRAAEADLRAAEAQLVPAQLRLDQIRRQDDPDPETLAQVERDYNAAVVAVEAARVALEELVAGATDAQRQAAGSGLAAATAQRDAAQAELDLLLAGNQAEQVAIAQAGLSQAKAALGEAQARVTQAEAGVTQAEADVSRSQAAVVAAQVALDERSLTAPFGGTVADISLEVGEVVNAGIPVVTLADFSGWIVETTDLTENDVVAVASGYPATVRVDALPDVVLTGQVGGNGTDGIATVSQETRGDVTYRVTILLDDDATEVPLRWGMTVFATIDTNQQ